MDKPGKTQCVSQPCRQVGGCPQASQHPATDAINLISGNDETSSRLPAFSLFLPGSCPNNRNRRSQRPWQKGYKDEKRFAEESKTLEQFKAEWSVVQGPVYRGTSFQFHRDHDGPYVVPDEFHRHYLVRAKRHKHHK
jgi:hypothetical protein